MVRVSHTASPWPMVLVERRDRGKNGEPWWDRTADPVIKSSGPGQTEQTQHDLSESDSSDQG